MNIDLDEANELLYEFVKNGDPKANNMLKGNYLASPYLLHAALHKIESLGFDTEISTHDHGKLKRCYISQTGRQVSFCEGRYKLAVVFETVVNFVKWYNELQQR